MPEAGPSLSRLTLAESDDVLFQPPSVIYPDRSTFSQALEVATRKLSLAHTHETNARYDVAFPLYLSCATGFLWAHRNVGRAGLQEDRVIKLRENLSRQTQKALERAERIKSVKGNDWAKRFSGVRRKLDVESQAKVLHSSSQVNGLTFEPWLPYSSIVPTSTSHPAPSVSAKQRKNGARFRRPSKAKVWDQQGEAPHGKDITQDAVTNCGLVAAMQVVAEHDRRWKTSMLRRPLASSSHGLHNVRIHYNGCPRHVIVNEELPFVSDEGEDGSTLRLMCACLRNQADEIILLPSLVEKAYLTILRSYAPPGSVPAEDLHALTGWLPEVIDLRQSCVQKEKTWQRIQRGWAEGNLLVCAGTAAASATQPSREEEAEERMATVGPFGLVPAHSYAVLGIGTTDRTLTLMNPWRHASSGQSGAKSSPFDMRWEDFCQHFATIHLAWNPIALFLQRDEVHASWPPSSHTSATQQQEDDTASVSRIRNVSFTLRVTSDGPSKAAAGELSTKSSEGTDEVWLHLSRHQTATDQGAGDDKVRAPKRFIAIHIFERSSSRQHTSSQQQDTRVIPLSSTSSSGTSRTSSGQIYVDSAHHLIRFKPQFYLTSILRSEQPGLTSSQEPMNKDYEIVVSLHDGEDAQETVNFTLRAWSTLPIALRDDDEEGEESSSRWETTVQGQWTDSTSGGHQMTPTFHQNPQYLLTVPPNTPSSSISFTLTASPPSLPIHIYVLHSPDSSSSTPRRVDLIEKANIVTESGSYAYGLTKARATLPPTPAGVSAKYHVILSTYEAGTKGSFTLEMASRDVKVTLSQRGLPAHGQVQFQHIPIEGAGMYHKRFKAAWDSSEGTDAGAPRFGRYERNPTWAVRVGTADPRSSTPVRCVFRLVAAQQTSPDDDNSPPPPINLSIFANSLGHEFATTGPYTVAPCGVAIHDARLQRGTQYLIVASTFQAGYQGHFDLLAWSEDREWQVTRMV